MATEDEKSQTRSTDGGENSLETWEKRAMQLVGHHEFTNFCYSLNNCSSCCIFICSGGMVRFWSTV